MELEQVNKQVNWLDEERRKDQLKIASLEERLKGLTAKMTPLEQHDNELDSQMTRLNALVAKIDSYDESLLQIRMENKQQQEERDRITKKRDEETEKIHRTEIKALETSIAEIRKDLEQFSEIKRNLKNRVEEELRLSRVIDEVRARMETIRRSDEDYIRNSQASG
jgi:chromosome segregation ATPase